MERVNKDLIAVEIAAVTLFSGCSDLNQWHYFQDAVILTILWVIVLVQIKAWEIHYIL